MRMTIAIRRARIHRLSKDFDAWIKMSDQELFQEVKKIFPAISEASRDECLKFLAMDQVEKLI